MALLDYLYAFIPMLGVLIFVHELGHFLVAKWCGVRVLKFSLGFGPPVGIGRFRLRWERGGTEYVIAWFPLGGFVKMLGEQLHGDGPEDVEVIDARPDEYLNAKPTWQKLAITFAGPVMNLLLPIALYMGVLWAGVPRPAPVVGMVETGSPAAAAGIEAGDRVVALDGEPVQWWGDVSGAVRDRSEGVVRLAIERDGETRSVSVPVELRSGLDDFGAVTTIGWIGIGSGRLPALVGVPDAASPAAEAGLRSGDLVTHVAGAPVEDWEGLRARILEQAAVAAAHGQRLALTIQRSEGERRRELEVELPARGAVENLGVVPATLLVQSVSEGRPAARAGLQAGDLILTLDGRPVGSFDSFAESVRSSGGRPLEITYARAGEVATASLTPVKDKLPGPLGIDGMEQEAYVIGIRHAFSMLPGVQALDRVRNPFESLPRAVAMTVDTTQSFLRGLGMFATGQVSTDQVAGPIGIAEIARKSLDLGWQIYISTMILISINLGILNLLPIPILDGGQALIYAVEGIKRQPISMRAREVVQSIGLTMLVMLMGLAFWNDLARKWASFWD